MLNVEFRMLNFEVRMLNGDCFTVDRSVSYRMFKGAAQDSENNFRIYFVCL
jgi:hypothetical protein